MMRNLIQYGKFCTVGLTATLLHALLFVMMIELLAMPALAANGFAFAFATTVSFYGHFHWTFERAVSASIRNPARRRFFVAAMLGLSLNSLIVYGVVDVLSLSYVIALLAMIAVVPALVFLVSKHWAFA